jgi:hypothetical protein
LRSSPWWPIAAALSRPLHSITSSARGEDRWRDCEAERLGGLQVDHQLEMGRLLDRQIGGLGALEDLSGVNADLAISSREARSIADQATGRGELAKAIDRRNDMVPPAPGAGRVD